jgi:hypothetical protein
MMLQKEVRGCGMDWCRWVYGQAEHGERPSVFIDGGEIIDQLSSCQLLKTILPHAGSNLTQ